MQQMLTNAKTCQTMQKEKGKRNEALMGFPFNGMALQFRGMALPITGREWSAVPSYWEFPSTGRPHGLTAATSHGPRMSGDVLRLSWKFYEIIGNHGKSKEIIGNH